MVWTAPTINRMAALAGLVVLASCGSMATSKNTGFQVLSGADGRVQIAGEEFATGAATRVLFSTAWDREEYVLYKASGIHAEMVHISTRDAGDGRLFIDQLFDLDGPLDSFRHSQSTTRTVGDAFRLRVKDVAYWAKPFQLPDSGETCAVFSGSWGLTRKYHRPSNVLFGIFCETGRDPLSANAITTRVSSITVEKENQRTIPIPAPTLDPDLDQSGVLARARGSSGSTEGIPVFPFKIVRPKMMALPGEG